MTAAQYVESTKVFEPSVLEVGAVRCWGTVAIAFLAIILAFPSAGARRGNEQQGNPQRSPTIDPLKQLEASFPGDVTLNESKHLLEVCPDNTCDGFVVSRGTPAATLKDFAYLYEYFFSEYYGLQKWRTGPEAKVTADQVLSRPEYRNCKKDNHMETARCVLLSLGHKGSVRLMFVSYDEGRRIVVPLDIVKTLSRKRTLPNSQ